jgi:hypothetical protein
MMTRGERQLLRETVGEDVLLMKTRTSLYRHPEPFGIQ